MSPMERARLCDRVLGSLATACIGDALGAPTEQRSIAEIRRIWGGRVERFYAPPADSPYAVGRGAGQITDDASQMLGLVDAYLEGDGVLTAERVAAALLRWSEDGRYFPHFAGPSTRAALERLRQGHDPSTAGSVGRVATEGATNGAAMRVAPAGLRHPGDPQAAVHDAAVSCLPTHGTDLAMSGAGCVAAAVAVALAPGSSLQDVIEAARSGAHDGRRLGRELGREVAGASVERRLELALETAAAASSLDEAVERIAGVVGTGLHINEAVPAALGIFLAAEGDPFLTVVGAANAGDDTDTVACMAGAVAGALRGRTAVPDDLYAQVVEANALDLEATAGALVDLVLRGGSPA